MFSQKKTNQRLSNNSYKYFKVSKKILLIAILDSALFSGDLVYSQFFPNLFVCPLRPMKIRHFSKETRGSNPFLAFYGLAGLAYDVSNSNYTYA